MRCTNIFLTVILLISIIFAFSGCLQTGEEKGTITAKEGYTTAEKIANNWRNDAQLENVGSSGYHDKNGGAHKWSFRYYSPSSTIVEGNITKYERIYIYVYPDKSANETSYIAKSSFRNPIVNWTIDSDEAVSIAKKNSKIDSYLSNYEEADIGMNLRMVNLDLPNGEKIIPDSATWSIGWSYDAGFDNPKNARIYINAHTGDVLYAEADE